MAILSTPTVHLTLANVQFSTGNRNLGAVFNVAGSNQILRIYRVWVNTDQTAAVTGTWPTIDIRRISAVWTVSTVQPNQITTVSCFLAKCDPSHPLYSGAFPTYVLYGWSGSVGSTEVLARYIWSSDEVAVGTFSQDEIQMPRVWNCYWDSGYGDADTTPFTCRAGEGMQVYSPASVGATGGVNIEFEFTLWSV